MVDDESEFLRSFNESHVKHAISQELGVVMPEIFNDSRKNRLLLSFSNPPIPIGGIIEHFSLWINDKLLDNSRITANCAPKITTTLKISKKTPLEIHQGGGLLISISNAKELLHLPNKGKAGMIEFKIYAKLKGIGDFPFSYFSFSKKTSAIQKKRTEQALKSLKRFTPITLNASGKKPTKPYVLSNGQGFLVIDSESNDVYAETLWGGVYHITSGHFKAPAWGIRTIRTATINDGQFSPKKTEKLAWTAPNSKDLLIEHGIVSSTHQQPGGFTVQKQTFLPMPNKDFPDAGEALIIHHTVSAIPQKSAPKKKKKASYVLEVTAALLPYGNISAVLRDEIKASIEDKGRSLKFYSKKTGMEARFTSTLPFKAYAANGARITPGNQKVLDEPKVYVAFDLSISPAQPTTIITAASVGNGAVLKQLINANQYPTVLNAVKTHYRNIFINAPSVSTPDPTLDEAYKKALVALDALKFDKPAEGLTGLVAGLPRFPNVWVRDAGESLEAVLMTNDSDFFRKSVEFICAKTPSRGEAPLLVSGKDYFHERLKYGSSDATLYVPILLKRYLEVCGDSEWLKKNYPKLKSMMSFVLERRGGKDLPVNGEYGTWMDHSPRAGTAIEIAALECEAFRSAAAIARTLNAPGKDAERWDAEAERLKKILNTRFWDEKEKSFKDVLPPSSPSKEDAAPKRRPNFLVPILLGIADAEKADLELARIENNSDGLLAPHGVRSLSSKDPAYTPYGYHDGSVWGLTTGWLAMAQLSRGRNDEGFKTISIMAERLLEENGMYAELYLGNAPKANASTVLQAFSVGTFIRAVIHHLFGIKVLANEKRVFLDPHFPSDWPRAQLNNVSVSTGNFIDLSFDNKARTITVYNRGKEEIEFVSSDGNSMKVVGGNIAVLPIPKDYYKTE